MKAEFKRQTKLCIAIGVIFAIMQYAESSMSGYYTRTVFILNILNALFFTLGCYSYAKGKGYHGAWGALGLFGIVGAIVLAFFPDRHKVQKTNATEESKPKAPALKKVYTPKPSQANYRPKQKQVQASPTGKATPRAPGQPTPRFKSREQYIEYLNSNKSEPASTSAASTHSQGGRKMSKGENFAYTWIALAAVVGIISFGYWLYKDYMVKEQRQMIEQARQAREQAIQRQLDALKCDTPDVLAIVKNILENKLSIRSVLSQKFQNAMIHNADKKFTTADNYYDQIDRHKKYAQASFDVWDYPLEFEGIDELSTYTGYRSCSADVRIGSASAHIRYTIEYVKDKDDFIITVDAN